MSLSLSNFIFEKGKSISNKEMRAYIKRTDPYFDMRKLSAFFGTRAYQQDGEWHNVMINSERLSELNEELINSATEAGLIVQVNTCVARADQINAVAKARGLDFTFHDNLTDYSVNWKGFVSQIHQVTYETHPSSKPLTAYDLTYWINRWGDEQVTEEEVIAAVDRETIRVKLNWDMGTGVAWKGIRLLNVFDLDWYTGRFPEKIAMNDGKNPPPPGEEYGYGYASLTEAAEARSMIIGEGNDES